MSIYFALEGLEALAKAIGDYQRFNENAKKVIMTNGGEMQQKAMEYAPVDTGFLKRAISLSIEDNGMTAIVRSEADYAGYQEWGTRYQPGTAHVGPAFKAQKPKFKEDMKKIMRSK